MITDTAIIKQHLENLTKNEKGFIRIHAPSLYGPSPKVKKMGNITLRQCSAGCVSIHIRHKNLYTINLHLLCEDAYLVLPYLE